MARTPNGRTSVTRMTGMDVGCKRDAEAALDGTLDYLSRGAMRNVYVDSRRRFVYKVPAKYGRRPLDVANADNVSEYERMVRFMSVKECRTFATPCALFYVDGVAVLAMPFRPRASYDASERQEEAFLRAVEAYNDRFGWDLEDMHPGNYRGTPTARLRLTDCGDVNW